MARPSSAVLLLAGVLLLAIAPSLVTPLNCTLNFLFTVEKRLLNEHVWNDFFRSASSKALYRVFLHNSVEGGVPPSHFESRPVPPVAAVLPGCSPQTSAILQLLSASTRESGPIDPHIVLPADSVPVKPFTKAYSEFCSSWKVSRIGAGSDTARPRRTASSLCVAPPSQWFIRPTQPSVTTTVPSGPTVRHDPWMVLNNTDALAVLAKRTDACGDASSAIASASTSTGDDKAHWWFYHALRGAAVTPPAHLDDEQGHCHTYYAVINATAPGGRPPAVTGAHVAPRWGIRIAPSTTVRTADGAIIDPPLALIGDLVRSPNFFFARGFRGHHHIVGAAQNYTLSEAFHVLQVFGHAPKKAHHLRERGPGDNGGLKVLVVSCDDREMKDRLEDNDYVSMTAVLLHDYTQRHGYDFMKLTGNSSFLVDRVLAKYRDRFFGRYDGIGEHKYGPSAFHPGLLHFRASSWAKIPHVWHAVSEYGEHYDYVWYMDSDAAINPAFRNRSLHDMLTHWQRQTDNTSALAAAAGQRPGAIQSRDVLGQVYWGQRDVRSADLLFFSNFPWRDDLPCAGIFLCRPRRAEPILREWWDYSLESRNRADFMEQDAMWFMLQAGEWGRGRGSHGTARGVVSDVIHDLTLPRLFPCLSSTLPVSRCRRRRRRPVVRLPHQQDQHGAHFRTRVPFRVVWPQLALARPYPQLPPKPPRVFPANAEDDRCE